MPPAVAEAVMRKAGEEEVPSNPACGVLARWAYSTQRAWGAVARRRAAPELVTSFGDLGQPGR